MRKYFIGGLVGLAIGLSATAYADDVQSLIGKTIQGQTALFLNGEQIDNAIIVDGRSYSPTRKIAESAGQAVTFNEGGIYLESTPTPTPVESTEPQPTPTPTPTPTPAVGPLPSEYVPPTPDPSEVLQKTISGKRGEVTNLEAQLDASTGAVLFFTNQGKPDRAATEQAKVDDYTAQIAQLNADIADLQAQLDALQGE